MTVHATNCRITTATRKEKNVATNPHHKQIKGPLAVQQPIRTPSEASSNPDRSPVKPGATAQGGSLPTSGKKETSKQTQFCNERKSLSETEIPNRTIEITQTNHQNNPIYPSKKPNGPARSRRTTGGLCVRKVQAANAAVSRSTRTQLPRVPLQWASSDLSPQIPIAIAFSTVHATFELKGAFPNHG